MATAASTTAATTAKPAAAATTTAAPPAKPTGSGDRTVDQFDREFQRYVTKHGSKGAQAVAMARAELAKYRALVWQDKKLEENKVKQGRLTAAQRQAYEKKIADIEKAIDAFHHSVASYNKTKAILSFALLVSFALLAFFQPWRKFL